MGVSEFLFTYLLLLTLPLLQNVLGNAELRALLEIKSSLDPENKYLSSWTSDGDPCSGSFEGVACNEHRKVANISLQGKGLQGNISPAVAGLKCLSGLYLHYNSLYGEIPREISNLTELSDLYLNVNSLSGTIPTQIGNMASLQVLQLCCNKLTGGIPKELGGLKKLNVLSLQYNRLTGQIPLSLGNLGMLKRLVLSFNQLSGPVPLRLAHVPQLEVLDVQNNTLSGVVPPALRRLNGGFQHENNPGLCGVGFSSLRVCTAWDDLNVNQIEPFAPTANNTAQRSIPKPADIQPLANQTHFSNSSKLPKIGIIAGAITVTITLMVAGFMRFYRRRWHKQKIASSYDTGDQIIISDEVKKLYMPMNCNGWDDIQNPNGAHYEFLQSYKFNLEEVEAATQYFSEVNLLGKSKFSAVYKGVLKDGSVVAIKRINVSSCKSEEAEFVKGLRLLTSLTHENLARLRGFCCSKGRGECFLIYDFASKGNLSQYLDVTNGSSQFLDWATRISIINGIARGIGYLHSSETNKPSIVHQNISVEKILIDQQFNPLIMDSGLLKLLADDIVFSVLKVSAAMGCMSPDYITTGHFTEKNDIYAFGVIILQILSGKRKLTNSIRLAAESCRFHDLIDTNIFGEFCEREATKVIEIARVCTDELPECRPTIEAVIEELSKSSGTC